jgi:hypothetical protein
MTKKRKARRRRKTAVYEDGRKRMRILEHYPEPHTRRRESKGRFRIRGE